jgi:DNA-directed RNA polymerase specialized sigma54-like protein
MSGRRTKEARLSLAEWFEETPDTRPVLSDRAVAAMIGASVRWTRRNIRKYREQKKAVR